MRKFLLLFTVVGFSTFAKAQWTTNGSGDVYNNNSSGKVGIGTNLPTGQLQIVGQSGWDKSTRLYITNGSTDYGRTNLILTGRMQAGNDAWTFGSDARNSIVFSSNYANSGQNIGAIGTEQFSIQHEQVSNSLGFLSQSKGSTPLLTMTQSGNVGIGPLVPQSKLHVNNGAIMASDINFNTINARLDGTSIPVLKFTRWTGGGSNQHNASVGQFYNTAAGNEYSFGIGTGVSSTGDQDATSNRMTILTNGNIGVGTSSPASKLEILGQVATGIRQNGTTNDFEALSIYNTTASNIPSGNGAIIQFYNNAANSNTNGSNTIYGASVKSVSTNNQYGWESDLYLRTTKNNSYSSQTILNALVIKGGSGNVGIGTANPDALLAVSGQVHAQEVKVSVSVPGPDYVFEKDYKLTSLEDIKNYIDQNKHLPEVPSAKEMEKNGVQLGEMNMLLLKKIEELTLLMIQMKEENEGMKKEIQELKTKK